MCCGARSVSETLFICLLIYNFCLFSLSLSSSKPNAKTIACSETFHAAKAINAKTVGRIIRTSSTFFRPVRHRGALRVPFSHGILNVFRDSTGTGPEQEKNDKNKSAVYEHRPRTRVTCGHRSSRAPMRNACDTWFVRNAARASCVHSGQLWQRNISTRSSLSTYCLTSVQPCTRKRTRQGRLWLFARGWGPIFFATIWTIVKLVSKYMI